MKTTFSRMFALVALVIMLCLILVGVAFRLMLNAYLVEEKRQTMHNNAEAMVNLAAVYDATGELNNRWGGFRLGMASAAQVAGTEVLFTDTEGQVHMCSCEGVGCVHSDWVVDEELFRRVIAFGEDFNERSTLEGLYDQTQFVEGMTVTSLVSGEVIGVVLVTSATDQITGMVTQTTAIFFYVAIFVLAVAMVFALVACGGGNSTPTENPAAKKVAEAVKENEAELVSTMEAAFATSSGLTCTSSIKAEGTGFVISLNINELEGVDGETKAQMQAAFDQQASVFNSLLAQIQTEIPELTYYTIRICEKDGDILATVKAGK
jgi:flagellar basal body-associated protein FliL